MNIGDLVRSTGEKHRIGIITKKSIYGYGYGNKPEIYIHWFNPEDNKDTSINGWKYQDSPHIEACK